MRGLIFLERFMKFVLLNPCVKRFSISILLLFILPAAAWSMPAEKNRELIWEHPGEPDLAGFYVYAAPESENPRQYTDARRFQIPNAAARDAIVLDLQPAIAKRWCFKVTAYDAAGSESDFSNEDCGFFGFTPPFGAAVK